MRFETIVFAGSLLLSTLSARAQQVPVTFEISPHYGYRWGGGIETEAGQDVSLKDGRAYGLSLDYSPRSDQDVKFELLWSRQDSGLNLSSIGGPDQVGMTVDVFQIGGVLETSQGRLHEYITGLIGATLFGPEGGDSDARFSWSIGGGLKYFLFRNLALRVDVRGICTVVESESAFISSGGVTYAHFSGSTLWQGEVSGGLTLAF